MTNALARADINVASRLDAAPLPQQTGVGKQEFLQLLIAQLQNQDPMKPMEDREFVTQLAQFSSLETLQAVQKRLEGLEKADTLGLASAMLGKSVEAKLPDGTVVAGLVTGVRIEAATPQLVVDGQFIDISYVTDVRP